VCIVDLRAGTSFYCPCGYLVRGHVTLESEVLQGCYCVYEVAARARLPAPAADAQDAAGAVGGAPEDIIPHTLRLVISGEGDAGGGAETRGGSAGNQL
jgi:hypothetical protein